MQWSFLCIVSTTWAQQNIILFPRSPLLCVCVCGMSPPSQRTLQSAWLHDSSVSIMEHYGVEKPQQYIETERFYKYALAWGWVGASFSLAFINYYIWKSRSKGFCCFYSFTSQMRVDCRTPHARRATTMIRRMLHEHHFSSLAYLFIFILFFCFTLSKRGSLGV